MRDSMDKYNIQDNRMYKLQDGSYVVFEDSHMSVLKYGTVFSMNLPDIDIKDLIMKTEFSEEEYQEIKREQENKETREDVNEKLFNLNTPDFEDQVKLIPEDKLKEMLLKYEQQEEYKKCAIIKKELDNR